jgi:predicted nucleotidyltransferase
VEKELEAPLRQAIRALSKHGYRYALIGRVALSQWGVVRATYDVDIKILVPDLDFDSVRSNLRTAFPVRARAHLPENPYIVAVNIDGVIVDFLLTLPGYEEQIIERAVQRDLGGWSVWICSAEDLIIQKASAGRSKDWPDIEALLIEQYGKLNYAYIEDWLQQFADALENPELLQEYHRLREHVESLR